MDNLECISRPVAAQPLLCIGLRAVSEYAAQKWGPHVNAAPKAESAQPAAAADATTRTGETRP